MKSLQTTIEQLDQKLRVEQDRRIDAEEKLRKYKDKVRSWFNDLSSDEEVEPV